MGPLSQILLLSYPLLALSSPQFFYETVDTGLEADRNERSQATYAGVNLVAYPTYQPSVSVYQPPAPTDPYNPYETKTTTLAPTTTSAPTFKDLYGFNLADKTRNDTDVLKQYLSQLDQNEEAARYINAHIEGNPCIDSISDMIVLIERAARIIENTGPEIELMFSTVNKLRDERDITMLMRGSADLLTQLDTVLPKLDTFSFTSMCRSSPEDGQQSLRDLAQVLFRMSKVADFRFTKSIKENLFQAAIITEVMTNFVAHFKENIEQYDCFSQKDFLGQGAFLAAEIIDDLAEALGTLGYLPMAQETRQYATFTRSVAESVGKLKDYKIEDDCSPGALVRAAGYLNDLANLIEEVGLVELGVNLGLVFRLDLLPDGSSSH